MIKTRAVIRRVSAWILLCLMTLILFTGCKKEKQVEYTGFSMDTVVSVKLFGGEDPEGVLASVNRLFSDTEETVSRYVSGSEAERLNRGERIVPEPWFYDLLEKNLLIAEETDGEFDPAAGALIDLWGIGTEDPEVPEEEAIQEAFLRTGPGRVHLSETEVYLEPGTILDLGASGKGAVLDRIRTYLEETDTKGAVIAAGGSVLLYGTHAGKAEYTVAVQLPDGNSGDYLGMLTLSDCCISTSGDYERYFIKNDKRYHHILSTRTGYPADTGLRSVTVVSRDGTLSDLLSTAVFLRGREEGLKLMEKHGAEGVLVSGDGTVTVTEGLADRFRLVSGGWQLEIYEGNHKTR